MASSTNTRCGNNACVAVEVEDDGVHVTSTIGGNDGLVVFTADEWDAFIGQVKAGQWDNTVRGLAVA